MVEVGDKVEIVKSGHSSQGKRGKVTQIDVWRGEIRNIRVSLEEGGITFARASSLRVIEKTGDKP